MKTGIIVQARMGSQRLWGKVLKEVLGRPLLDFQIERLRRAKNADALIIATTTSPSDDVIADLCTKLGIALFRGSEQDVLSRYHGAAKENKLDIVVRVTADCPVIDSAVIDRVIAHYQEAASFDYVSNTQTRTYPRGMDTEVFSFEALDQSHREASEKPDREHVTPFIYRRPHRFRLGQVTHPADESRHRWTVDTAEDFELIRRFFETLHTSKPDFTLEDCLALMKKNPEWFFINSGVKQKVYGE